MRRMNGDAPRLGAGVALALLATALLAGRLAEGDLIGDPVIYAAVAKSMLVRGEWGTQYLAGQPFIDKPPSSYGSRRCPSSSSASPPGARGSRAWRSASPPVSSSGGSAPS